MPARKDVVIVGAGHNGLVAATVLARSGLDVAVIEAQPVVGGAARTAYPFEKAPRLGTSPGAYLLGLMPPELITRLGARFTLLRRDPHYFLPTRGRRHLLIGSDAAAARRQCIEFFSEADWLAMAALEREIAAIREDLAPCWLEEPESIDETAARYIRPSLRRPFLDLVRDPVEDYLARFGFRSDLLMAMYAVTDGFSGLHAGFGDRGTGLNFLVHNMCRLPGSDGTWMIAKGGMGSVTGELARLATEAGATIVTGTPVERIVTRGGRVTGVVTQDDGEIDAPVVVSAADPFRTREMVGAAAFDTGFNAKINGFARPGTTLKVNLAFDRLPVFTCLPEDRGQWNGTIHIMPQGPGVIADITRAYAEARAGQLPAFPAIEWYTHTRVDPSLQDADGRHSGALFVQWVPHTLQTSSWDAEETRYVRHLLGILDTFAPGTSNCVIDAFTLTPPKIAQHFGMTAGHIHHVDNSFGFDQRMPYVLPVDGLYACGAGCHPAGSVIGAAGYVAATRILRDLGRHT